MDTNHVHIKERLDSLFEHMKTSKAETKQQLDGLGTSVTTLVEVHKGLKLQSEEDFQKRFTVVEEAVTASKAQWEQQLKTLETTLRAYCDEKKDELDNAFQAQLKDCTKEQQLKTLETTLYTYCDEKEDELNNFFQGELQDCTFLSRRCSVVIDSAILITLLYTYIAQRATHTFEGLLAVLAAPTYPLDATL